MNIRLRTLPYGVIFVLNHNLIAKLNHMEIDLLKSNKKEPNINSKKDGEFHIKKLGSFDVISDKMVILRILKSASLIHFKNFLCSSHFTLFNQNLPRFNIKVIKICSERSHLKSHHNKCLKTSKVQRSYSGSQTKPPSL